MINMNKDSEYGVFWERILIVVLIGLIITSTIFVILTFYVHQISVTVMENKSPVIKTTYALFFDDELWTKINAKEILIGMLSASAAIVAVAFTITQLLISNISERYTPHVLEFYLKKNHHNAPFFYLLSVVASSSVLLLILDNIANWLELIFIIITLELFLWSLIAFIKNYHDIFKIINPLSFLDYLTNDALEDIRGD